MTIEAWEPLVTEPYRNGNAHLTFSKTAFLLAAHNRAPLYDCLIQMIISEPPAPGAVGSFTS